jgi:AAA15 family ATPase/GTPase
MKSLDSVIIHQFRGIRDLELKDLGRVNLLVGINNSGKTSVLEALQIYSNPLDIKTWLITACQRELQNRMPRKLLIDALRWLFSQTPVSTIESPELIILISSTGLFSVKKLIASYEVIEEIRLLSQARFRNFKSDVVRLLQQIDSNISDIEILSPPQSISSVSTSSVYIYIQHKKLGLVPLSSFGDGIRRLLHIALKLSSVKEGGILLIDELDSTIHTEALQNYFQWLVKWCAEMDVQLFATTHSLEAVDALLQVTESDSDLVLYRLEPKEEKTRVVRHDGYRLRRLRQELGQEVRW